MNERAMFEKAINFKDYEKSVNFFFGVAIKENSGKYPGFNPLDNQYIDFKAYMMTRDPGESEQLEEREGI